MKPNKSSPAYLKKKNSGGLFVGFLYVLVFMSILALGIWQNFETNAKKKSLESIYQRLGVIEEQINIADEINNDSLTDISASIQFLDKEVRKLWDLSNKRNKVNITKLIETTNSINNSIKTIELSLKEASDRIKSNKLIISENSQDLINLSENNSQIKDLDTALRSLETQMILMDDSVRALNNYRTQLNQTISEIQTQIYSESQNVLEIENQD
jgi:predicted  nucleic acid-binding Zn-ribbon protein